MAAGSIFKIIIKVGKQFFGTNSAKIADDLVKQGGKRVPKTKIPKSADVKRAPTVPNPKSPKTGQFTRAQPPAVKSKTDPKVSGRSSVPKKATAPKAPAKPKVSTSSVPKTRAKPTNVAKPKRTKPPLTRVPGRTNALPPKKTSAPAVLRSSTLESGPEVKLSPTDKQKTDRKFVPKTTPKTKKTGKPDRTAPPRTAPASGPATNESFGKAFKRNRKAGKATFMWRDKKYTTRFKEETIAQHKKKFGVEGKY